MVGKVRLYFKDNQGIAKWVMATGAILCVTPMISSPMALLMGLVLAQFVQNPFKAINGRLVDKLLKISVVGLGFGMDALSVLQAGRAGFMSTFFSIGLTLLLGSYLGHRFGVDKKLAQLISSGTAICGGSAIAALSPVIRANGKQVSIALAIVFALNSVALFLFPVIGNTLNLSQHQFGVWCAIAIHDTSSVVGAAKMYGEEALQVATITKLARALWIVPVSLLFALLRNGDRKRIRLPYFIVFFLLAVLANTYVPMVHSLSDVFAYISRIGLTLVLFLLGMGMDRSVIKRVGGRPLALGVLVWSFISFVSLAIIVMGMD
ncbi:MAG: putative sulfate exporter family transporter [Sediminicola sp.]